MNTITFLILRRMRAPLVVLIVAYAVSVLGLVLIPGADAGGQPWPMDFFHALYFVSYMATTIGFGEIPHPFTDAQRLWVMVCIYVTVIAWLYAIGTILALFQNPALREAITASKFARSVRALRESFYLVCGYGDTGSLLVQALTDRGRRAVAIDIDPARINALVLQDYHSYVPGLCADAAQPDSLVDAGLRSPRCAGVPAAVPQ